MKKKIGIYYKQNGIFNNAVLTVEKQMIELLEISKQDNNIIIEFKDNTITLKKGITDKEIEINNLNGGIIELKKNIGVNFSKISKEKDYYVAKLNIPFSVVNTLKLTPTENEVDITLNEKDKFITIKKVTKMGKMIAFKNNKGGVGKTFMTLQISHGLAMQGYKVIILTSDSQNNIIDFALKEEEIDKLELKKGLRSWVMHGKGEIITLRKNLDFIPLESSVFTDKFLERLPLFLQKLKEEYDYILVDSIPTMKIDTEFIKFADKIIIPTFCDMPTLKGMINVIEEAGIDKVHSIIVNLYRPTATQKEILNRMKNIVKDTDIIFPEPIKELSQIETLVKKGKTIWESKARVIEEAQTSLLDVILYL
jgi:chromosome partitioning protein